MPDTPDEGGPIPSGRHRVMVAEKGDAWSQSVEQFLSSLIATGIAGQSCDLVMAAGLPLTKPPSSEEVLNASDETPVLFEAKAEGFRSWFLAHVRDERPQLAQLRLRQIVSASDQHDSFPLVAKVIASGAGTITFLGINFKLVLFICGENNLLQSSDNSSVLKATPADEQDQASLASALSSPWAVLNPAHKPYYPHALPTGFAKVGTVVMTDRRAGPTLRRVAESRNHFNDGTKSPLAIIHVNNFFTDKPATVPFSSVAFGDSKDRVCCIHGPVAGTLGDSGAAWRFSVFELRLDQHEDA